MSDPNCLEGLGRTPDEMAENLRKLNAVAPTVADKFALMFGHPRTTPETDAMASMSRTHQEWCSHSTMLERQRDELLDFLTRLDAMACDDEYGSSDFRKVCRYDIPKAIAAVKGA